MSNHKTKLLLLCTNGGIGGTERVVLNLARGLKNLPFHVRTVFPTQDDIQPMQEWYRQEGVEIELTESLRHMARPRGKRDLLNLMRFVRASDSTVVSLHNGTGYMSLHDVIAVRAAGGGRRLVVSNHHPTPWNLVPPRFRKETRIAARLCHKIIVPTPLMQGVLRETPIADAKMEIIPYGVTVPARLPSRADARRALGLSEELFVLSTVSRLVEEKGMLELIEGVSRVPDPQGRLRLLIAGTGTLQEQMKTLADAKMPGRAIFLGRVPDTTDVYAASDLFVLPSHLEGFGLVFIEAAFHGVPSIGTNVGGVPYAIEDGKTGMLVPVKDDAAFAASIKKLWDHAALRRQMGEAARARACSEFTETRMAERYAAVLTGKPSV